METLNVFEQSLLLYAKRRYTYAGERVEGARVLVAYIAGTPAEDIRNRDIARWLVNILAWINRISPRSFGGGIEVAINDCFDYMSSRRPPDALRGQLEFWSSVVEALLGQITITRVLDGVESLFVLPEIDIDAQQFLDAAYAKRGVLVDMES